MAALDCHYLKSNRFLAANPCQPRALDGASEGRPSQQVPPDRGPTTRLSPFGPVRISQTKGDTACWNSMNAGPGQFSGAACGGPKSHHSPDSDLARSHDFLCILHRRQACRARLLRIGACAAGAAEPYVSSTRRALGQPRAHQSASCAQLRFVLGNVGDEPRLRRRCGDCLRSPRAQFRLCFRHASRAAWQLPTACLAPHSAWYTAS